MLPRSALLLPVAAALVAGIAGGLVRAGVGLPAVLAGDWMGPAVVAHAFLMICVFLGTVIGIERAVALRQPLGFAGPIASGAAGLVLLAGADEYARGLVAAASLAFVAVSVAVVARQRAAHTVVLLVAALAWAAGCLLHAFHAPAGAVVPWWFGFLVLTVAAERLEMTRLMPRRDGATRALHGLFGGLLLGAALSAVAPSWGGLAFGLSLSGIAAWLMAFDIARRTVRAEGLSRYMAVCLLLGYGWLFVAGLAWAATAAGLPFRDAALHALGLGFVFGMILGHAPVILPAVAGVKLRFGRAWYLPLALLHGSLAVRLVAGHGDAPALANGAAANGLAIVLFAATVAASAIVGRSARPQPPSQPHERLHPRPRSERSHGVATHR